MARERVVLAGMNTMPFLIHGYINTLQWHKLLLPQEEKMLLSLLRMSLFSHTPWQKKQFFGSQAVS